MRAHWLPSFHSRVSPRGQLGRVLTHRWLSLGHLNNAMWLGSSPGHRDHHLHASSESSAMQTFFQVPAPPQIPILAQAAIGKLFAAWLEAPRRPGRALNRSRGVWAGQGVLCSTGAQREQKHDLLIWYRYWSLQVYQLARTGLVCIIFNDSISCSAQFHWSVLPVCGFPTTLC